jgi:hypothetical protein
LRQPLAATSGPSAARDVPSLNAVMATMPKAPDGTTKGPKPPDARRTNSE